MRIIYNCYGGSHSSITAAAIHVGLLPETRVAKKEELLNVPYFDAQVAPDHGRIRFIGFDEYGNEVYITSKKNLGRQYESIMRQFIYLAGGKQEDFLFINTMPYVNFLMVIGGYTSRRLGLSLLGRPIVIRGTQLSYMKFVHLVRLVKNKFLKQNMEDRCENCLP
ncbi:MAG: hypothetical protein JG781_1335 [Peptococcaceae bacterium]|nr:hypothetical protein [Peptococcaceae bacterium]